MIRRTAYSRSGLVGNPSDIFGGKVISLLFDAFRAQATVYESPRLTVVPSDRDRTTFDDAEALIGYRGRFGYYGGIRLIEALIVRLHRYCRDRGIDLPRRNFTVEYSSDIPFGVGLGGSSAIITAVFLALMDFYELTDADIPKPEQPTIVLETETEELGITAGPQDRVIAVYGGVVVMDFSEQAARAQRRPTRRLTSRCRRSCCRRCSWPGTSGCPSPPAPCTTRCATAPPSSTIRR